MKQELKGIDIDEMLSRQSRRKDLVATLLPFAGLVLITVLLTVATNGLLLSAGNLVNIMNQCFTTAIVGVGAAFVYAHGGMDFSIGASCGVSQLACIFLVTKAGAPLWCGVLAAIAVGVLCSLIVGGGAELLHLQPFIVSLCVRSACTGILVVGCNALGKEIRVPMHTFLIFNNNIIKGVVLAALIVFGWYLFEKTRVGKEEKAAGGNRVTAKQSGIQVRKNVVLAYIIMGACVGLAATFQMARVGVVTTSSGTGLEFNILLAIALGGFPMAGGSAAKLRSLIVGVATMTILTNGLLLCGVDSDYISGIKGLLFVAIVAVSYDRSNLKQVSLI